MPATDLDEEQQGHGASVLPTDPRMATAILGERVKNVSKQVDKMDRTLEGVFDLLNELRESIKDLSVKAAEKHTCPMLSTCTAMDKSVQDLQKRVGEHEQLVARLDGYKRATLLWCSVVSFIIGVSSPFLVRVIFK